MTEFIDHIRRQFQRNGHLAYGEVVDLRAHMLQTAYMAEQKGANAELITACLLHDYGHLIVDLPEDAARKGVDGRHELLGAEALAPHFSARVVEAVGLHVDAKRYLCAKSQEYRDRLSEASAYSLAIQGGPMDRQEMAEFESNPWHRDALQVRVYDDLGKVPNLACPDLDYYLDIARSCLL